MNSSERVDLMRAGRWSPAMKRAMLAQLFDEMPISEITKSLTENFDSFAIDAIVAHLNIVREKIRRKESRIKMTV